MMPDIQIESITLPITQDEQTEPVKYKFPIVDSDLTTEGAAADAKKVGDELTDLKGDINEKVDKPIIGVERELTLRDGYYQANGGFIATSAYKAGSCAVESGETLLLSGSGTVDKPAYLFTNGWTIFSKAEEALEMNDYEVVAPAGSTKVLLNTVGTNKTLAVKVPEIDENFDISDLVKDVSEMSTTVSGLQTDVDDIKHNKFDTYEATQSTNFNSVQVNSAYNVKLNTLIIVSNHVPENYFTGTIYVTGDATGNVQQLALSDENKLYVRVKNDNVWSDWHKIAFNEAYNALYSTDLNTTSEINIAFEYNQSGVQSNHVPYIYFQGCVLSIKGTNYGGQIAVSKTGGVYIRPKSDGTWGNWEELAKKSVVDALVTDYEILSEFDNISCLGDSLTYGTVYYGAGSDFRRAKKPYPEVLAVRTGATVENISEGGITASQFVTKYINGVTQKTNHLCIIYLGTNGGLTDTIDTDAPGTDKSQYDTTTNTGAYCYIVKHCLDIGAKVLILSCPMANTVTNETIGKVATKFNVAMITISDMPRKYHMWPNGQSVDAIHLNDFGYAAFAEYIMRCINTLSDTEFAKLLPE